MAMAHVTHCIVRGTHLRWTVETSLKHIDSISFHFYQIPVKEPLELMKKLCSHIRLSRMDSVPVRHQVNRQLNLQCAGCPDEE